MSVGVRRRASYLLISLVLLIVPNCSTTYYSLRSIKAKVNAQLVVHILLAASCWLAMKSIGKESTYHLRSSQQVREHFGLSRNKSRSMRSKCSACVSNYSHLEMCNFALFLCKSHNRKSAMDLLALHNISSNDRLYLEVNDDLD